MPRSQAIKHYLTFVGGLHTEANPLTFPENVAKDLDNVDLRRDGSIIRRRGLDFEEGGAYSRDYLPDISTFAITIHEWESVDGDDELNFLVIQVGGTLYFHQLGDDILSLSVIGKLDLEDIAFDLATYKTVPISATSGKGHLFIVSEAIEPAFIRYDSDDNTFVGVALNLQVRDTEGLEEEENPQEEFANSEAITPPSPGYVS